MRRVFYFSGYRMKVFEWRDNALLGSFEFEPDNNGHEQFREFLLEAAPCSAQLLVDVIEEDFRRENIPHVNSRDRKVLLERLLDRHYRGDSHIHVQMLGRSKEGRKDDQVLLSALTNTDPLVPWLKEIEEQNTPLAGIWSVPLLSHKLIKPASQQEDNILIVSRQIVSALRESYFKKGKMVFSRQAKLDPDVRDSEDPEAYSQSLVQETDQTYRFLTNQRIMGFTEQLNVYVISPDDQVEALKSLTPDTNTVKYKFLSLNSLLTHFKIQNVSHRHADVLFAYLCSQQPLRRDHYAERKQKHPFYRFIIDRSITNVATLGAILIATSAALLWLYSFELKKEKVVLEKDTAVLAGLYERNFSPMQQQLDDALTVKETVLLAKRLQQEANQTPQRFFTPLGRVLVQTDFQGIQVEKMEWKKYEAYQLTQLREKLKQETSTSSDSDEEESESYDDDASPMPQPVITLEGHFLRGDLNYRDTVAVMRQFIDSVVALQDVEEVHALRLPVDVRPASNFTDESGTHQSDDRVTTAGQGNVFELLLVLKAASHG